MIVDPRIRQAEGIAEKVVMKYMGKKSSMDVVAAIQKEYHEALKKAGIPEGLVCIHLDQGSGSVYIHQPSPDFVKRGAEHVN